MERRNNNNKTERNFFSWNQSGRSRAGEKGTSYPPEQLAKRGYCIYKWHYCIPAGFISESSDEYQPFTAQGSTCSFKRDDCGCNEKTDDGHDDALHGLISMASFFPLKPSGYIIVDFLCNFWLSSTINCRIKSSKHDPRQKKQSTI